MACIAEQNINSAHIDVKTASSSSSAKTENPISQCTSYGDNSSDHVLASSIKHSSSDHVLVSVIRHTTVGQSTTNKVTGRIRKHLNNNVTGRLGQSPSNNVTGRLAQSPSNNVTGRLGQSPSLNVTGRLGQSPSNNVTGRLGQSPSNNVTGRLGQYPSNNVIGRLGQSPGNNIRGRVGQSPSNNVKGRVCQSPSNIKSARVGPSPSNNVKGRVRKYLSNNVTGRVGQFHSNNVDDSYTEDEPGSYMLSVVSNKIRCKYDDVYTVGDSHQMMSSTQSPQDTDSDVGAVVVSNDAHDEHVYIFESRVPTTSTDTGDEDRNAFYFQNQSPSDLMPVEGSDNEDTNEFYLQDQSLSDLMQEQGSGNEHSNSVYLQDQSLNDLMRDEESGNEDISEIYLQNQLPSDLMREEGSGNDDINELYLQHQSPEEEGSDYARDGDFDDSYDQDSPTGQLVPIVCSTPKYFWEREQYQSGISLGSRLQQYINYIYKSDGHFSRSDAIRMLQGASAAGASQDLDGIVEENDVTTTQSKETNAYSGSVESDHLGNARTTRSKRNAIDQDEVSNRRPRNFASTLKFWRGVESIMVPNFVRDAVSLLDDSETSIYDTDTEDHLCFGDTGSTSQSYTQGFNWTGSEYDNSTPIEKPGSGDGDVTGQSSIVSYRRRGIGCRLLCIWWSFTILFLLFLLILLFSENFVPGIFSKHIPCECKNVLGLFRNIASEPQDDGDL